MTLRPLPISPSQPTTFQLLRHNNKESSAASHSVIPVATGIPSPFRHPVAGKQEWSACGARVFRIYNTNTRVTLTRHSRHSGNPEPFPHPNTWDNAGVVHTGLVSLAERRGVLRIPTKSFEIKGSGFPLRRERRGWGCAPILTSPSRGKEDIQDAPAAVYNAIALRAATVYLNGRGPCGTLSLNHRGPIYRGPTQIVCSEGRLNGLRNT